MTFPDRYPSSEPPTYQLAAPWLRGVKRQELHDALEEIYLENMGENIIHLWIEKVREVLDAESSQGRPFVLDRILKGLVCQRFGVYCFCRG